MELDLQAKSAAKTPASFQRPLIIGFYQMDWFQKLSGDRLKQLESVYRNADEWRDMLAKTPSGKVLQPIFKDLWDRIIWRMPNPGQRKESFRAHAIGTMAGLTMPDYDAGYILHFLGQLKPEIVFGLGESAIQGIGRVATSVPLQGAVFFAKHPLEEGALESLVGLTYEIRMELEAYGKN